MSVEATNSHDTYFTRNLIAMRSEQRQALAVYRANAFTAVVRLYPRGAGIEDAESRVVFNSLIARDPPLVELVDYPDSPSGDAFILTDAAAEAFRAAAEEGVADATMN